MIAILSLAFRSLSPATTMDAPLWAPDYFMSVFRLVIFILLFFFFFSPTFCQVTFQLDFLPILSFSYFVSALWCFVDFFFFFSHLKNIFLMAQSPYFTLAHGNIFRWEFLGGVLWCPFPPASLQCLWAHAITSPFYKSQPRFTLVFS